MSGDATNGNKDEVKLQLHNITERMSKLLCNYEGEKEFIPFDRDNVEENADDKFMKDGVMGVLTDFHNMANAREELLETLMNWFEGSNKMLSTTEPTDDPEESWKHIEHEMQRLLTTVESLQQPNRIADIERKLLGVVLKEDNIEKIEQIRDEYSGKGSSSSVVGNEPINGESGEEETSMNQNKEIGNNQISINGNKQNDNTVCISDTLEIKECCQKEIQVNTMDDNPLTQDSVDEISDGLQLKADNKLCYTNASTQTKLTKKTDAIRSKYKHSHQQQQTNTKQCCEENKINKQETNFQSENTNIDVNNLDSIEISFDRKVNEITDENIENDFENNISCTTINTQIQQLISNKSIAKQMHLETELITPQIQEYEDRTTTTTTTTLPRIKWQPKRHNKNRITNAIRDLSKSGAVFTINVKTEEWSRHKVYMHLPIATTRNRGLGLIPPNNKRTVITPTTNTEFLFPILNRNKTVPIEIQLNTIPVTKFKLEVINRDALYNYGIKTGRIRAVTIL